MDGTDGEVQRVSFRAAARIIGVSERTVRRWAAAGRVTVSQDEDGLPRISRADALRLRSENLQRGTVREQRDAPQVTVRDTSTDKLEALGLKVAELERRLADAVEDRNFWRDQAQTLAKALPPAPPPPAPAAPAPTQASQEARHRWSLREWLRGW